MVVNADSGEVAGVNPLETGRDVDLELEAVRPVRRWKQALFTQVADQTSHA